MRREVIFFKEESDIYRDEFTMKLKDYFTNVRFVPVLKFQYVTENVLENLRRSDFAGIVLTSPRAAVCFAIYIYIATLILLLLLLFYRIFFLKQRAMDQAKQIQME